jgi:hypothetical protein
MTETETDDSVTIPATQADVLPPEAVWSALIPEEQWAVLAAGAEALDAAGTPFLLAGAIALATYTGHWRNTKDMDVIIPAEFRERAIGALRQAGFEDYFDRQAYDRSWIFRGFRDGVLFDVIWALPNHRVGIDAEWFAHATSIGLRGRRYLAAPAEELVRVKLYVMQRERCDWVDVLNVLAATVDRLAWPRLVARMGRDLPLLHAALAIFNWMCPGRAHALPAWLRKQFALPRVEADDLVATEERRVRLFDSRPWFALHQPADRPLER